MRKNPRHRERHRITVLSAKRQMSRRSCGSCFWRIAATSEFHTRVPSKGHTRVTGRGEDPARALAGEGGTYSNPNCIDQNIFVATCRNALRSSPSQAIDVIRPFVVAYYGRNQVRPFVDTYRVVNQRQRWRGARPSSIHRGGRETQAQPRDRLEKAAVSRDQTAGSRGTDRCRLNHNGLCR